jgi:cellulose synthase/poly-beta-1,6-N-acetylglucosamine synthase-like glycosyltransferase
MRAVANGEILVLTDARQPLSPGAVRALVAPLADPTVGAVAGDLAMTGATGAGAYWRYEKWIRDAEARFRGTVGVSGALWAVRRADLPELPDDVILDDVWLPMAIRLRGLRVVAAPDAVAHDEALPDGRELRRKVRTLAGNYQLFARQPRLLDPFANPVWLETVSHKALRLLCPWALLALAVATASAWPASWAAALGVAQLMGFGAAALGARAGRVGTLCRTFVVMNAAALLGLWGWATGRQRVAW